MIDIEVIAAPSFRVDVSGAAFVMGAMNRRMADLVGRAGQSSASLVGLSMQRLLGDGASRVEEGYRTCFRTRSPVTLEPPVQLLGCGPLWHVSVLPVLGANGRQVAALINAATRAEDQQPAERDRRETSARMALALEVLEGGFWHYDIANRVLDASPRLLELMIGTALDGVSWDAFVASVHPDDLGLADIAPLVDGMRDTGVVEYRVRAAGGDLRWVRCKRKLIRDPQGAPDTVIGVVVDITEDKRIRSQIEQRATTDVLTKLFNRRGFEECAELYVARAAATGSGFGLVLVDLDRFKPINDGYGHATGDLVLQCMARRIARELRPTDMAARIGGDEFAVLVADIDAEPISRLGERIVRALALPVDTPAGSVMVGASVGMACGRGPSASIDELFGRADAALYDIKRSGRGACKLAA